MLRTIDSSSCIDGGVLSEEEVLLDKSRIWFVFRRKVRNVVDRRYLGVAWLILNPIVTALVYLFVFTVIRSSPNAAILLTGISMYTIFSNSFKSGMNSINDFSGGLKAERVRTRVLTYSMVYYRLFDTILQASGISLILYLGLDIGASGVATFILLCIIMSLMTEGVALNISTVTKRVPDLTNVVNYALLFGFFASPALYSMNTTSGIHYRANTYNPFSYFVEAVRDASGLDSAFWELWNTTAWAIMFLVTLLTIRGYTSLDSQRWGVSSWS